MKRYKSYHKQKRQYHLKICLLHNYFHVFLQVLAIKMKQGMIVITIIIP